MTEVGSPEYVTVQSENNPTGPGSTSSSHITDRVQSFSPGQLDTPQPFPDTNEHEVSIPEPSPEPEYTIESVPPNPTGYVLPQRINRGIPPKRFCPDCAGCESQYPIAHHMTTESLTKPLQTFTNVLCSNPIRRSDIYLSIIMADWANLLPDLLAMIAQRLAAHDFIVFCAVCQSWLSASHTLKEKPALPPWLVLAEEENNKEVSRRGFFSLSTFKTYEFELPEASGRKCIGANYGCFLTLGTDLQINLVNPFTRKQINLPPMLTLEEQFNYSDEFRPEDCIGMFVCKVALSTNPWANEDLTSCVVALIYGEFCILAFARLEDRLWTNIRVPNRCYEDIIYYRGKFLAVDCHGTIVVCDIDNNNNGDRPIARKLLAPRPPGTRDTDQKYLVESSSGYLLLVIRFRKGTLFEGGEDDGQKLRYYTVGFSVLKLDKCGTSACDDHHHLQEDQGSSRNTTTITTPKYRYKLTEVNNLGDMALFLGRNPSVFLPASKFGGSLRANCIYFTDDNSELFHSEPGGGGRDMGIFDMETRIIEPHYPGYSRHTFSTPFWLM
ncbi:hypothetical protein ACH5RR_019542 [Cinchona calisaya]|uniref:KIB1-4 beta-propeller domain-containing protein n=1 Tax=Cinchona calisaya TaxID=153742 RepID=A0ABD2ZQX3_9GENT